MCSIPLEGARSVLSALLPVLLFECWVLGSFLEEVVEGCLQVPKCLLWWNAGDLSHPFITFSSFQLGQHRRGCVVVDRVTFGIGICPSAQGPVVHKACDTKHPSKHRHLHFSGVVSESVPKFHKSMVVSCEPLVKPPRSDHSSVA